MRRPGAHPGPASHKTVQNLGGLRWPAERKPGPSLGRGVVLAKAGRCPSAAPPGSGRSHQQMRWSPRGAHRMLKVRTAVANGTLADDHAAAERWARRPFRPAA